MPAIDIATLLDETKCYACYGASLTDLVKLGLLSRIANNTATPATPAVTYAERLVDHFIGNVDSNAAPVGERNWVVYGTTATVRARNQTGRWGTVIIQTNALAAATAGVGSKYDASTGGGICSPNTGPWKLTFVFRLNETTDVFHRIGLLAVGTLGTTTAELSGCYLRHRASTDGGFFQFVNRLAAGGPETTAASTVAVDTNWHTLTLRSVTIGTVLYSLDGEPEIAITQNYLGSGQSIVCLAGTEAVAAKAIYLDKLVIETPY